MGSATTPSTEAIDSVQDLWVFGYGSIVWKNNEVERIEEVDAFIHGYKRRFWQYSTCHRGTIEFPGLVVSIYDREEWGQLHDGHDNNNNNNDDNDDDENGWYVHGRAFRVTKSYRERVLHKLIKRESGGFEAKWIPIYTYNKETQREELLCPLGLTFIANIRNRNFAGKLTVKDIANVIFKSTGPSGSNLEYAVNLYHALNRAEHPDRHVTEVVQQVEKISQNRHVDDDDDSETKTSSDD